jgi:hypothetical protein
MEKILHLTLKKKWFDMIASGEKKEEYREMKGYWWKRLCTVGPVKFSLATILNNGERVDSLFIDYTHIIFRNGYQKNAPQITVQCLGIEIGNAKPEWSDNWSGNVFIIKLGNLTPNKE